MAETDSPDKVRDTNWTEWDGGLLTWIQDELLPKLFMDWRRGSGVEADPRRWHGEPYDAAPRFTDNPFTQAYPVMPATQRHTGFGGPPVGVRFNAGPSVEPRYPVGPPLPPPGNVGAGAPRVFTDAERFGTPQGYDPTPSYHPPVEYYDTVPDPNMRSNGGPSVEEIVNLVMRRPVPRPAITQDTRSVRNGGENAVKFMQMLKSGGGPQ